MKLSKNKNSNSRINQTSKCSGVSISCNIINGHISEWINTLVGVPQGSVIAPMLLSSLSPK